MPPPLPAVAEVTVTTVSFPAIMSIVDYDRQPDPESAETAIKKFERENASELELLNATYAHTAYLFSKERLNW